MPPDADLHLGQVPELRRHDPAWLHVLDLQADRGLSRDGPGVHGTYCMTPEPGCGSYGFRVVHDGSPAAGENNHTLQMDTNYFCNCFAKPPIAGVKSSQSSDSDPTSPATIDAIGRFASPATLTQPTQMNFALCRNAAFAAALLFCAVGHAATDVYSQPPSGSVIKNSAVLNATSDPGFQWTSDSDQELWAYFKLPSALTFNQVSWYGSNADGSFAVDLFSATCFSCSPVLVGGDGTFGGNLLSSAGPYSQTQVQKSLVAGTSNIYAYTINLPASVTLPVLPTTSYYVISVVNNYSLLPFQWAGSGTGLGTYLQYTVGQAMFLPGPGNPAFTLTNTAAVPEPAAAMTLSVGLALIGVTVGRRKRQGEQAGSVRWI